METLSLNQTQDFYSKMPKLELHAHLNGSLSLDTLQKLQNLKSKTYDSHQDFKSLSSLNLTECFHLFPLIHNLTDTPEAIFMATCDVIKDFYNDGVYYLELRTTPKAVENSMTQESYAETVLKAIETVTSELKGEMFVKLILSIDRKRPLSSAEETLKIAEKHFTSSQSVIGIDLSGDPNAGNVNQFIPILEYAKKIGLKLALHIAEVPDVNEEVKKFLNLHPHRLGHGTFLPPSRGGSAENFSTLKELKIPLEICLTSNVVCKTVPSYEEHHFKMFKEMDYPCILCTDDKGIFDTSLSKEYHLASQYYFLSSTQLYDLSYNSINYTFATENEKHELKQLWKLKKSFLRL